MTALSPAVVVVDRVAGLNLNHRNCCWLQCGSESCYELLNWVATNCDDVGTIVGLDGFLHRWTALHQNFIWRTMKIDGTTKSLVERLVDFKIYALPVPGYLGSISAPDRATIKEEAHALQCITAGSYKAIPTNLLRAGSTCGLGLDTFGIHLLSLAARYITAV